MGAKLSDNAIKCMRYLFAFGPTTMFNLIISFGGKELLKQGLADSGWGYMWLTRDGIDYAINVERLDISKSRLLEEMRSMRKKAGGKGRVSAVLGDLEEESD